MSTANGVGGCPRIEEGDNAGGLSPRELEVLALIADGHRTVISPRP
jgi:hypothetical protein